MFGWIRRWKQKRNSSKRLIFSYWDGEKIRHADPWKLWRGIFAHPTCDILTTLPFVDTSKEPETTQVLTAICEVFNVKSYDETTQSGLIDYEVLDLISSLIEFVDALKKNSSRGLMQSVPTESESLTSQEAPPNPIPSS